MYPVILTLHIIICLLVILIVLIQAGRSGGFSGILGGGGGDALFSTSSQQSGLRKATLIIAGLFIATSFFLTILSSRRSGQSVFERQFPALPPVGVPQTDTNPILPVDPSNVAPGANAVPQQAPAAPAQAPAAGKEQPKKP